MHRSWLLYCGIIMLATVALAQSPPAQIVENTAEATVYGVPTHVDFLLLLEVQESWHIGFN